MHSASSNSALISNRALPLQLEDGLHLAFFTDTRCVLLELLAYICVRCED